MSVAQFLRIATILLIMFVPICTLILSYDFISPQHLSFCHGLAKRTNILIENTIL